MSKVTEESFLKDIASHKMKVINDDGINRHIRFCKKGSSDMQFDLITWHGYLCYTGDMGTYVFQRTIDMFEFFRGRIRREGLHIGPGYWHEKLEAVDRTDGSTEFSLEKFREAVDDYIDDDCSDELIEEVKENLLDVDFQFEIEARQAIDDFDFEDFKFSDFFECDLQDYTSRYIWACYAIAWGIQQYDLENVKT